MPVRFDALRGHDAAIEDLVRRHRGGRFPHALLVEGPDGVGKRTLGLALAGLLLCERPDAGGACGACPSCTKLDVHAHPDLFWLPFLEDEGPRDKTGRPPPQPHLEPGPGARIPYRRHVQVDDVRALERGLHYRPLEGVAKVAILDEAHRLGPGAHPQNALLKTLEEPPASTHLVLLTHRRSALLPTIQSRCQALTLRPLGRADLERVLERVAPEQSPEARRLLAQFADGAPGRALELDLEAMLERRDEVARLDARIDPAAPDAPLRAMEEAHQLGALAREDRALLGSHLDVWASWARDQVALAAGLGPERLIHPDRADELERAARRRGLESCIARADALLEARRQLELPFNLNPTLIAEQLLLTLAGRLHLARIAPR